MATLPRWFRDTLHHAVILLPAYAIVYGTIYVVTTYIFPALRRYEVVAEIFNDPWRLGAVVALSLPVYYASKYIKRRSDTKRLLQSVGLYCAYKNPQDKGAVWQVIQEHIHTRPAVLRVLAITGWNIFGEKNSPLHKMLHDFQGDIQILLLSRESKFVQMRAKSLEVDPNKYLEELDGSIDYCRELKRTKYICLKGYIHKPIWTMIGIGEWVWVRFYKPGERGGEMQFFGFFANAKEDSLYYAFTSMFLNMWWDNGSKEIDLSSPRALGS